MKVKYSMPDKKEKKNQSSKKSALISHIAPSNLTIQQMILWSFTLLIVIAMIFLGLILYVLFDNRMVESAKSNSEQLVQQAQDNLEDYLDNMLGIRDTMTSLIGQSPNLTKKQLEDSMNLLYQSNAENVVSIACYTSQGDLLASVPYSMAKKNADVVGADWFQRARIGLEHSYISTPHVQNLFEINGYHYFWVVSLSNVIELQQDGKTTRGVLVVDMNYSSIGKVFRELNSESQSTYTYLMESSGSIIYHPKANLITSGLFEENEKNVVGRPDGSWQENFKGERRIITVKTMDYTNWRIVRVMPGQYISLRLQDTRYIIVIIFLLVIMILTFGTMLVSAQITRPLNELTTSMEILDEDGLPECIKVGGSYEVEYLGNTLRDFVERLRRLMDDIVKEQEEKRKSELDALQAQINPHFLYNTLDSIIWMIEGERYQEAIFMIRELASLFRISLSKGKTMITIEDELKHAKNYMNIQSVRYRNRFEIDYEIDPDILQCVIVKLVLQPILENALYYAVEALDGDGEIYVKGYRDGEDIYISVTDNGMGMEKEVVDHLLEENNHVPKHGSGVGLVNIHKRLQIRFGPQYGLQIESEPDEGTTVTLHLPYQLYEQERAQTARPKEEKDE